MLASIFSPQERPPAGSAAEPTPDARASWSPKVPRPARESMTRSRKSSVALTADVVDRDQQPTIVATSRVESSEAAIDRDPHEPSSIIATSRVETADAVMARESRDGPPKRRITATSFSPTPRVAKKRVARSAPIAALDPIEKPAPKDRERQKAGPRNQRDADAAHHKKEKEKDKDKDKDKDKEKETEKEKDKEKEEGKEKEKEKDKPDVEASDAQKGDQRAPQDRDECSFKRFANHRWVGNSMEIRVEWEDGDVTWEPEANLHADALDTLLQYWSRQGGRPTNPVAPDMYDIFAIRKHSRDRRRLLVEWVGYGPNDASWVSRSAVEETAPEVVKEYWRTMGRR
ncbi:hypothetical protein CDD83_274 [Cordyceps sp. RAO-2017]|nr:hypothetical protein CDD83_274 [Cordyceps sp. RAO-2017]